MYLRLAHSILGLPQRVVILTYGVKSALNQGMSKDKASPMGSELPPYEPPPEKADLSWLPPDLRPGADLGDPDRPHWETSRLGADYSGKPEGISWGDFALVPGKPLSPGHRKICQLYAMGMSGKEISEAVGITEARLAVLRSNTLFIREIARLQEKVFEETIQERMKGMGTAALDAIESAVRNETKEFKSSERLSAATWLLEKLDGKATQKHDVGENLLGILLDRLDAKKTATRPTQIIDVQALPSPEEDQKEPERDPLADFVADFAKR